MSLEELLATSAPCAAARPDLAAVGALVASACASARRRVRLPAVRELAARAPPGPGRRVNWAVALGLALAVVLGFGIYRVLPGSPRAVFAAPGREPSTAGTARRLALRPAQHAGPGAEGQPCSRGTVHGTGHAGAAPPQPTPQRLAGARGRNPGLGHPVISGLRPGGGWYTGGYISARFGNPYPGTRLLLDMGRTVAVISMRINLARFPAPVSG